VQFALAATRYAHQYDLPVEELKRILAKIAVKNHANGAKNPKAHFRREIAIDLAEVHDCFTITELLIYEDVGFAPRGRARERVDAGTVELNGELTVNPDGGLKCFSHPIGGSGLRMIYEVYKQLQGKAGSRQRKNPTLGLTHNIGGRPGSFTCSVAIFGK
jgi:acetyl-CoA C-acetyltransferase